MGGDDANGDGLLVVALEPFLHRSVWYAHMEGFRNRSMIIMSGKPVGRPSCHP